MPRFTPPPLLEKGVAIVGEGRFRAWKVYSIFLRDAKLPSWETRVDTFNAGFDFSKWKFLGRSWRKSFLAAKLEIMLIEMIFTFK